MRSTAVFRYHRSMLTHILPWQRVLAVCPLLASCDGAASASVLTLASCLLLLPAALIYPLVLSRASAPVRAACWMLLIASGLSALQMLAQAYSPAVSALLIGRIGALAATCTVLWPISSRGVWTSIRSTGASAATIVLVVGSLGLLRELAADRFLFAATPAAALIALALLLALMQERGARLSSKPHRR
jgi:Na+-translocating ferredoxin:NAD+ oxidoreductase RnfE subunit